MLYSRYGSTIPYSDPGKTLGFFLNLFTMVNISHRQHGSESVFVVCCFAIPQAAICAASPCLFI